MSHRQLIIMRHATTGSSHGRDRDRTLTQRGLDEARRVGMRLRSEGLIPERVLCSSAVRCRQTWAGVAAGLGDRAAPPPRVDFEDVLYSASPSTLADAIAALGEEQIVLLLAHNPSVSQFAYELGRGREAEAPGLQSGFSPASTACFEVEGPWSLLSTRTARLIRFTEPPSDG